MAHAPLEPGRHTIVLDFEPDQPIPGCPATATVSVDGEQVCDFEKPSGMNRLEMATQLD